MSIRQARIIKRLRAELEDTRKLLRAYQLLYGKTPQEPLRYQIINAASTTAVWQFCPICYCNYDPRLPHEHVLSSGSGWNSLLGQSNVSS